MSLQPYAIAALALVVVALLVFRQLRWTRFDANRVLRLPIVPEKAESLPLPHGPADPAHG